MAKRPSDNNADCIDLCSSDDENDKKPAAINNNNNNAAARKKVKTEPSLGVNADDDDDEIETLKVVPATNNKDSEVEVVTPTTRAIVPAQSSMAAMNDGDDDVVLVGAANVQKLPHLRQHCTENKFDAAKPLWSDKFFYKEATVDVNEKHCDMCYCYACDCLVKDCTSWHHHHHQGGFCDMETNHCCAHDGFATWTMKRKAAQGQQASGPGGNAAVASNPYARAVVTGRAASNSSAAATSARVAAFLQQQHRRIHQSARQSAAQQQQPPPARKRGPDPRLTSGEFHLREHCPQFKFLPGTISSIGKIPFPIIAHNVESCDQCWCYVCDKPANNGRKRCKSWRKPGKYHLAGNHCCAHQGEVKWVNERAKVNPGAASTLENVGTYAAGNGPFAPDFQVAGRDKTLTKCRHCGWYTRFSHLNFRAPAKPTGCHDWCHKCGRVASEKDLGKANKGVPYTPKATDFSLGEKVIPFRLHAHDPRKVDPFKQSWEENKDKWTLNEADMEEELFLHRFGDRPTLDMILASLPILKEVPQSGVFLKTFFDGSTGVGGRNTASPRLNTAIETEAMILERHSHKALLEILHSVATVATDYKDVHVSQRCLFGDITAKFDKTTRSGALTVRLFLPQEAFANSSTDRAGLGSSIPFGDLLGNWFDIYPFSLSDVSGLLKAKKEGNKNHVERFHAVPCPPFKLRTEEQAAQVAASRTSRHKAIGDQKASLEASCAKLSLLSSSGSRLAGGVCNDDISLKGCLQRFCSETLAEELFAGPMVSMATMQGFRIPGSLYHSGNLSKYQKKIYSNVCWVESSLGVVSHHRQMNKVTSTPKTTFHSEVAMQAIERFLTPEDAVLAASNFQSDVLRLIDQTSSMKGILEQLENLGHAGVPFVEGLNIELLEFQKQGLQWALDREQVPGGIQSYWWAKVPIASGEEIYYNPILQRFRRTKPQLIRGGFIACEMGLGKTVLSLGLILCNPAKEFPTSGSNVKKLKDQTRGASYTGNSVGWDEELYARTSSDVPKRGSIVSRGTLVVCPVSLVGQWIEEAKSKLKDPGIVYAYHGGSRKRDPQILARNAIVVTTYEVISSDATYHANKAGEGYVAPLEQIRWWRIICDEGHSLRQGNTKRSSCLLQLVADHKWLVSGTPVNTTFNDLRNQLRFLGIECSDTIMDEFKKNAYIHLGDPSAARNTVETPSFGNMLFFLRNIMLRHTQKQTYRGTSTTLMSLPEKKEQVLEIDFSPEDRQHYLSLEDTAKSFYRDFKAQHRGTLSRHHLLLKSKLSQIRIACAGGPYPLEDVEDDEAMEDVEHDDEDGTKKKKKKVTVYSDFVFQSKFRTLLKELENTRDKDPTSKSLVFCTYSSTLQWLQDELPKHGFQFRTIHGSMSMKKRAKALHDFQADPPTTIFLLSMRSGNVGLNLTQANRVFIMEPCFNPALEEQAIGRVHRLGQKRPTLITRLVMKDSVETRLMKVREKKYGSASAAQTKPEDMGKKPAASGAAAPTPIVLVGNVQSDRATIAGEEFDELYGVTGGMSAPEDPEMVSSMAI